MVGGRRARLRVAARWLTRVELPLLLPLFLAGAVSTRAWPALLVAALLFWPLRWLAYGRLTVRTPADWPLGLLLLTIPVILWATALPDVTRPQVLRLLAGLALYCAIANWTNSPARLRTLTAGFMAAGLLLAASAPVSVQWMAGGKLTFIPEAIYRRLPLLLADPIHPNVMAGALAVLLPCALGPLLFGWGRLRWPERVLGGLASAAMLGVVILTKSRGGLMALGAVLVVLAALRWRFGWLTAPLAAVAGLACSRFEDPIPSP
ncbi:MAG: hypothetical protein CVU38_17185 [Chloroflexi bacterium HGW-Chloroflexi-1]|nr:MAG: hypothetical protein CVU38_17185 [Chloroflexi bacterium HGW-Chloroflexi-1]